MAKKVYWIGSPGFCDSCHTPIENSFIDGKTITGQWGNFHIKCAKFLCVKLGTGSGQQYEKQEDGRFLKVGG